MGHQAYSLATWKSNLDFPTVDHEQEQTNSQALNLSSTSQWMTTLQAASRSTVRLVPRPPQRQDCLLPAVRLQRPVPSESVQFQPKSQKPAQPKHSAVRFSQTLSCPPVGGLCRLCGNQFSKSPEITCFRIQPRPPADSPNVKLQEDATQNYQELVHLMGISIGLSRRTAAASASPGSRSPNRLVSEYAGILLKLSHPGSPDGCIHKPAAILLKPWN